MLYLGVSPVSIHPIRSRMRLRSDRHPAARPRTERRVSSAVRSRGGCRTRSWRGLAAGLLLSWTGAGCELDEVVTPAGEDLLVVEAVLRAGDSRQSVLLHRTLGGRVVRGEPDARVEVVTPAGAVVRLREVGIHACTHGLLLEATDSLQIEASCYLADVGDGLEVRPGGSYELRVRTTRGEVARGRTTVPGAFRLHTPALPEGNPPACSLAPNTILPVVWSPAAGAWSYLVEAALLGVREALDGTGVDPPDVLELTGLAISERDTILLVPTQLGVFDRLGWEQELLRRLQHGLPAGVRVRLVVAAVDRNYVNAMRGGGFNPSGEVRVSSVVGDAVGVFGSLVYRHLSIAVEDGEYVPIGSDQPYPPCLPP